MADAEPLPLPEGVGAPARRALAAIGVTHLEHVRHHSRFELQLLHGMGPKALGRLHDALAAAGWTFADA